MRETLGPHWVRTSGDRDARPVFPTPKEGNTPMKTCNRCPAPARGELCDNCWEVERRLPNYLKSPAGRAHVLALLTADKYLRPGESLDDVVKRIAAGLDRSHHHPE